MSRPRYEGREFLCRPLGHVLRELERAGHTTERALRGIEYPLSHLLDVSERIDWGSVEVLGRNVLELCSEEEVLGIGQRALRSPALRAIGAVARYVFSPQEYYRWGLRELESYCTCLQVSVHRIALAEVECEVLLAPGYAGVPALFVALRGALMSMTEIYGREPARVHMEVLERGVRYHIALPGTSGPWRRLRPRVVWGLTRRDAARELQHANDLLYARHVQLLRSDVQLRESQRLYQALLEQAFDPVLITDGAGRLLHANAKACEIFGEPLEVLRTRAPTDLISVPGRELGRFLEGLRDHGGDRVEAVCARADGTTFAVEIGCSRLSDGRFQAVLRDLEPRRQADEARRRYAAELEVQVAARTAELERANAELRDLQARFVEAERMRAAEAATVGLARSIHDPLTALIGNLEMASESPSDSVRAVRQGLHLARRIRATVCDDLDRLDLGGSARRTPEAPARLLEEVEAALGARARELGLRVEVKAEPHLPLVSVDRALLVGALVGIGANGLEAMQSGQTLCLEVGLLGNARVVQLRVIDQGGGIPRSLLERVFEPHFTTKSGRAGLGLSIARGVVRGHRGRLRIEERPGGGTVVTVELPALQVDLAGAASPT